MTDREKAIVMAYTGKCMLTEDKFHIFHEYIEEIMGRPVFTHELADKDIQDKIKEKSKDDFIALCEEYEKKKEPCEDCVSRVDLINKFEIVDKRYGSDFYWEVRKIVDSLPSVKPVACIGTVKIKKEDMQELLDEKVKELVLENAR